MKSPTAAIDFLVFDEASALHEVLMRSGFHLRDHAEVTHYKPLRRLTARLVWRNRHSDSVVLTLRIGVPK